MMTRIGKMARIQQVLMDRFDAEGTDLCADMLARACRIPEYAQKLDAWLKSQSTLDLRIAAAPFGDYWDSLEFTNKVDALDSATHYTESAPAPAM